MVIDETSQNLQGPIGSQVRSYRIEGRDRFKETDYVINGIEDQVFVIVFEYMTLVCGYKTPNRTVVFKVQSLVFKVKREYNLS